jgi:hypothetical protein
LISLADFRDEMLIDELKDTTRESPSRRLPLAPGSRIFDPSTAFQFVGRHLESLNLSLDHLPDPESDMPQDRGVVPFEHIPSATVVANDELALMSVIDEVTIEGHTPWLPVFAVSKARTPAFTSSLHQ